MKNHKRPYRSAARYLDPFKLDSVTGRADGYGRVRSASTRQAALRTNSVRTQAVPERSTELSYARKRLLVCRHVGSLP
jgi:hypothetical protein